MKTRKGARANPCALIVDICMGQTVVIISKEEHFEKLMANNPEMQRKARKIIASVLAKARKEVSGDAKTFMENDPRDAYKAVKRMVYKRMLGGNLSILNRKKASSTRVRVTNDTPHTGRGGNRRPRSQRTEQVDSYYGQDRGFILRFVNAGTAMRTTKYGNRGSISARNWFKGASESALASAAEQFALLVDNEIQNTQV